MIALDEKSDDCQSYYNSFCVYTAHYGHLWLCYRGVHTNDNPSEMAVDTLSKGNPEASMPDWVFFHSLG